jgi:hypothetical protein
MMYSQARRQRIANGLASNHKTRAGLTIAENNRSVCGSANAGAKATFSMESFAAIGKEPFLFRQ